MSEVEVGNSKPVHETETRVHLTDEQINDIAERAAKKAVESMANMVYQEVGKGILKKALFLIGAAVIGAIIWMKEHNWTTGH